MLEMEDKGIDLDMECLDGNDGISLDETILKVKSLDQLLMPPSVAKEALESHRLMWQQLEKISGSLC